MVKSCPQCAASNRDDATFCSSCGASFAAPTVKPVPSVRVVSPAAPSTAVRVPPPGMCYYHPSLPAVYVCSRCGRAICRDDSRAYGDLTMCPQCYAGIYPVAVPAPTMSYAPPPPMALPAPCPPPGPMPMAAGPMPMAAMGPPGPPPMAGPGFLPPRPRPLWGFLLALVAGILTIIAGASATALLYANLAIVPAWLVDYWMVPMGIGILLGLVVVLGAFLTWQGYSTLGGILTFIFSLANIYLAILIVVPAVIFYAPIAIGIVALVFGLIGGLLGILSK